jgi:hypothetical protein
LQDYIENFTSDFCLLNLHFAILLLDALLLQLNLLRLRCGCIPQLCRAMVECQLRLSRVARHGVISIDHLRKMIIESESFRSTPARKEAVAASGFFWSAQYIQPMLSKAAG